MKAKIAKDNTPTMSKESSSKSGQDDKPKHVDPALVEKAVSALIKYHLDQESKKEGGASLSLLGNDRAIQVQFGLELAPGKARKVVRIDIPNPFHHTTSTQGSDEGLEEPDVCLIVKDESKPWIQEIVEEYSELMGCIKKVLTLDSLRRKHKSFQQRRELLAKYDVFIADDRITPMLTSALGKDFVKAKKLPIPLTIIRKEALPFAIQKCLSSAYMTISQGTSITIRAGNTGMPEKKLAENVVAIAENAVGKIPRQWANIRNIAIKTPESASLPFYHKLPEELVEIARLAGISPAFKDSTNDNAAVTEEDKGEDNNESNKRKRDLAAKSPLVRALKKQKEVSKGNGKAKASKEDEKKAKKEKEKKSGSDDTSNASSKSSKKKRKESESEEINPEKSETPKSAKAEKKKEKESESEALLNKDKPPKSAKKKADRDEKEFVSSKKFRGSKEGYVFLRGTQGVGYYIDKKPVVDKMMLQALIRASSQGGNGRSRSKSGGKRRGRR